ncbi:hypothetical protein [Sphingomonas aracearum]|uniref:Uncharacterized protein n=1 Tax=Sphingomonas aracearum TaxID=2283317 RepID=A0A369VQI5_9SPHN|nr:hypothetical protein [Sphingomonas aracearum]RDE04273.1 hypothetical protein DVW87_16710 [Sphingomonas aracearum]
MTLLLTLALAVIAFLVRRNYQLEKRWRSLRYCWYSMSDLAAGRLNQDGEPDEQWLTAMREQAAFMARFGASPLSSEGVRLYEAALLERNVPILTEHRV